MDTPQLNIKLAYKTFSRTLVLILVGACLSMYASSAFTAQTEAERITVEQAWARATFALAKTGAAYMKITNTGSEALTLISASVGADIANISELHHTILEDDMMMMQELTEGIKIEPKQSLEFQPGGKHIMMMGLQKPLLAGQTFMISLEFADGSSKEVEFTVKEMHKLIN